MQIIPDFLLDDLPDEAGGAGSPGPGCLLVAGGKSGS